MNFAHLHLILNHLPIIGIPLATLFLAHSLFRGNASSRKFAFFILFFISLTVIPIYLTGEPAEKVIEHLPEFSESFIEPHEDAAMVSMILTLILGGFSGICHFFIKDESKLRSASKVLFFIATLATASLGYTGNLGGKVRHTELRGDASLIPAHE